MLPLLILLCLCAPATLSAEMIDGSAIVTSRSGSVSATNASGDRVSVNARNILQPTGLQLATQEDGRIFLTFSNGVAIALDAGTSIECREYTQRPFNKKEQSQGLEPSISKFLLKFSQGQIGIASNRLSPLSELRIEMPEGEIRFHKGTSLISYDSTGLHISAIEGSLTYYYPDGNSRVFISAPKSVRISDQSMARNQIAETTSSELLEAPAKQFCQAVQHASKRVLFEANDATGLPPVPVLIVRPEYFEQPAKRPYQFKD